MRNWFYWNNWDVNGIMVGIEGYDGVMVMEGIIVCDMVVFIYVNEVVLIDYGNI